MMTGLYSNPKWRALREKQLAKNPVCQVCGSYMSLEVHHVNPVTKRDLEENNEAVLFPPIKKLVTYCESCHSKVTRNVPDREITASREWDAFREGE